jgi:hypothetical protein
MRSSIISTCHQILFFFIFLWQIKPPPISELIRNLCIGDGRREISPVQGHCLHRLTKTQNRGRHTSVPRVRFESAIAAKAFSALDRTVTVIGPVLLWWWNKKNEMGGVYSTRGGVKKYEYIHHFSRKSFKKTTGKRGRRELFCDYVAWIHMSHHTV